MDFRKDIRVHDGFNSGYEEVRRLREEQTKVPGAPMRGKEEGIGKASIDLVHLKDTWLYFDQFWDFVKI